MSPENQGVFQLLKEMNLRVSCHSSEASMSNESVYFLVSLGRALHLVNTHEH